MAVRRGMRRGVEVGRRRSLNGGSLASFSSSRAGVGGGRCEGDAVSYVVTGSMGGAWCASIRVGSSVADVVGDVRAELPTGGWRDGLSWRCSSGPGRRLTGCGGVRGLRGRLWRAAWLVDEGGDPRLDRRRPGTSVSDMGRRIGTHSRRSVAALVGTESALDGLKHGRSSAIRGTALHWGTLRAVQRTSSRQRCLAPPGTEA